MTCGDSKTCDERMRLYSTIVRVCAIAAAATSAVVHEPSLTHMLVHSALHHNSCG